MKSDRIKKSDRIMRTDRVAESDQKTVSDETGKSGQIIELSQTTDSNRIMKSDEKSGQNAGQKPEEISSGSRRYGLFGVSAYPEKQRMDTDKRRSMSRWAGGVILFLSAGVLLLLLAAGSGSKGLTVTFESMGGSSAAVQSVPFGGTAEEPAQVVRPGYVLKGWSITPDGSQPWNFEIDTVTETLTLYAVWEAVLE